MVRIFADLNRTGCFLDIPLTMRVNGFTGSNQIATASTTVCSGFDPPPFSDINSPTSSNASGTITYRWESSTAGSSPTWSPISPAVTTAVYDPPVLSSTVAYRRVAISTLNGATCESYSNTVTITVSGGAIPNVTLSSNRPSNTVCFDDTTNTTVFTATSTGSPTRYDFYFNNIIAQTGTSTTFTISNSTISGTAAIFVQAFNSGGCFDQSVTTTIVENTITPAGTITGAQTVCQGDLPTLLQGVTSPTSVIPRINGVLAGNGDFQWQISTDDIVFTDIFGATNANYQPTTLLSPGTRYYRRQVVGSRNGVTCEVNSNSVRVQFAASPAAGITSNQGSGTTLTICQSSTLIFTGSGGRSFDFRINGSSQALVNATGLLTTAVFDASSLINDNDRVTVIVYDQLNQGGCSTTSSEVLVNVVAQPNGTLTSSALNNTICIGDSVNFTATAGGITGATYRFKINGINTATVTTTNVQNSATFSPTGVLPNPFELSVDIETPNGCTTSVSIELFQNSITSAGTITGTQTICQGNTPSQITSTASATSFNASATISYRWESSTDNFITDISNTGVTTVNYQPLPLVLYKTVPPTRNS